MVLQTPPVEVGDKLTVEIENRTPHGQGIAKIEGFVIFVDGVEAGEKVKIVIEKVARTYAVAKKTK